MSGLTFSVTGARAKERAASPAIAFALDVSSPQPVEAMVLRAEVRIEPQWRRYDPQEQALLDDLFGKPERWGTTLRALAWADVPVVVTAFESGAQIRIDVPCTYDFDVTATRFLHALGGGEIPIRFLFSGTIFTAGASGFSCERVPWSAEAAYRMPVRLWRDAMEAFYGPHALIRIGPDTLENLHRLRSRTGALSWDDLFGRLSGVGEPT